MIGAKFESREPMIFRGFIVAISVLLGGLIWSTNVDPSNAIDVANPTENVSPIVTHFKLSPEGKICKIFK